MARFDGRAMVVTGGGSGIGKATATRLAADGARVAVWDLDGDSARATSAAIGGIPVRCNVNDPDSVVEAARSTDEQLGDVSGVVNAAGIFIVEGSVESCSIEDWDRVLGVNLRGVFLVSKALLPAIRRTTGSIVNVASLYGFRGYLDEVAYDASKGAIVNLTRQMALQYAAEGIRVNAVAPGEILTPLTKAQFKPDVPEEEQIAGIAARVPMGRMGRPEEIASVISFLMSEDASYVSGAILPVDGAFLAG